jgi:hypothetical protein
MTALRDRLEKSEGFDRVLIAWRLQATRSVLDFVDYVEGL